MIKANILWSRSEKFKEALQKIESKGKFRAPGKTTLSAYLEVELYLTQGFHYQTQFVANDCIAISGNGITVALIEYEKEGER